MERDNEIKRIEEKINYITGIYARAGIFYPARGEKDIYILLIASFYLDYQETRLEEIFRRISKVCYIEITDMLLLIIFWIIDYILQHHIL